MKLLILVCLTLCCHGFPRLPFHFHRLKWINSGGSHSLTFKKRPFFHPRPKFSILNEKKFAASALLGEKEIIELGFQYSLKRLGLLPSDLNLTWSYTDTANVTHIYFKHLVNGIEVSNHNAAVHMSKSRIVAFSSSFNNSPQKLEKRYHRSIHDNRISKERALSIAFNEFKVTIHRKKPVELKYIELPNGMISQAYSIHLKDKTNWLHVFVDTQQGQVVHVIDYISSAKYRAIPLNLVDPINNSTNIIDPHDKTASPIGWHQAKISFTNTQGNNARVYSVGKGNKRYFAEGGKQLEFLAGFQKEKPPQDSRDASITNLFYVINMMHDLSFAYGFTPAAGNFQFLNFNYPGLENDGVIARTQISSSMNDAHFATSPDGEPGEMNLYLFDKTYPLRDSALENDIAIHEYQHGISNRLTGGASNADCLEEDISAGLDEGWSDAVAIFISRNNEHSRHSDVTIGDYVCNGENLRTVPYSTNITKNTLKYSSLNVRKESHEIGEIWCTMLFEVFWNLVDEYGFSPSIFEASQSHGNVVTLQLLMDGLSLQSCQPDFILARDAFLLADDMRYNGIHKCSIWKAFAKRGLGINASRDSWVDNHDLGEGCV